MGLALGFRNTSVRRNKGSSAARPIGTGWIGLVGREIRASRAGKEQVHITIEELRGAPVYGLRKLGLYCQQLAHRPIIPTFRTSAEAFRSN